MSTFCSLTFFNEIGILANKSDLNISFAVSPDDGNEKANLEEYLDVRHIYYLWINTCHDIADHQDTTDRTSDNTFCS